MIVFGPIVTYDQALPRLLARSLDLNNPDFAGRHRRQSDADLDKEFAGELEGKAEYISVYQALCDKIGCTVWADTTTPLQFDGDHLTEPGSALLGRRVAPLLFSRLRSASNG